MRLRPATLSDAERLLMWRNDPVTLRNSINQASVEPDDHVKWLEATLGRQDRILLVAECDDRPVGTVRFDGDYAEREISFTVAPEVRSQGFGKLMVSQAVTEYGSSAKLVARIKPHNISSISIITSCGFFQAGSDGDMIVFRRP
jgi:RimJ/RimL family protein N-acetyltransferase